MSATPLYVTLLLTSFGFALAALSSLYGVRRAYLALSWVPAAAFAVVAALWRLSQYQPSAVNWPDVVMAVAWTGLIQCVVGAALAARAAWRGKSCAGLLIAACLSGVPFLIRTQV